MQLVDPFFGVLEEWDIELDTNGDLETVIGQIHDFAPIPAVGAPPIKMNAQLTFYGRDGTVCSL